MKGLLLKDWYMMIKYCRAYFVLAIGFIAVSIFGSDNLFFMFYPCLLCGMIPVNLLGYDERSRWIGYSCTLPYTKTQIVSAKYLIGLFAQIAVVVVTGIAQGIKMRITGNFLLGDFAALMLTVLIMATFTSSISLPFIFKYGIEKGRIAYYVMLGIVFAVTVTSSMIIGRSQGEIQANIPLMVLALVGVGLYALSWCLSVIFYKKREIQ